MQPDALIAEFQNKNPKAFERIYERYSESTFGIIFSIVKNEAMAEEVLQDVFIKVWNNCEAYDSSKGRFFTWLLNIARNSAIDKTRSKAFKNSKKNLTADYFVDILEDKDSFSNRVDAIGIKKYIKLIQPFCEKIIDLLYFKGFTQVDAAEELEIPLGTLKTRNRNCINRLREILVEP